MPDKLRKRQLAEEARYGEIWRGLIGSAVAEGTLRADLNPYITQMLILGSLSWTAEWWNPERGKVDVIVAHAKSFVRHAIAA